MTTPINSDDQVISKYVEYLNNVSKFPASKKTEELKNYILSTYGENKTYYTRDKMIDIHNIALSIYINADNLKVLKRLYFGYLKYDYLSSINIDKIGSTNISQRALQEYENFKIKNKINNTDVDIVKNEAIIDLLVFIQRYINELENNIKINNIRLQNILQNKINNEMKLVNDSKKILNDKIDQNRSIDKSDIEIKAANSSYIIQEYYEVENYIGVY